MERRSFIKLLGLSVVATQAIADMITEPAINLNGWMVSPEDAKIIKDGGWGVAEPEPWTVSGTFDIGAPNGDTSAIYHVHWDGDTMTYYDDELTPTIHVGDDTKIWGQNGR